MPTESVRTFLDQIITEGRRLAQTGEDEVARQLGVGEAPEERARLRRAAAAGGAALGVLGLLLGGRRRGFGRSALLAAGAASLGKVAMDAWSRGGAGGTPLSDLDGDAAEGRSRTLLFAMVAAAKADGHIDEEEESALEAEIEDLPAAVRATLSEAMRRPADPEAVARLVGDEQEGREVYAASALLCGRDHPLEVEYLDRLARALDLAPEEARRIEEGLVA